jgi:hypothetical protein
MLFVAASSHTVLAQSDASRKVFEVEVDGQVIDVQEGQETILDLEDGRKLNVLVREKTVQAYRTDTLQFKYNISYSIKDDKAEGDRQITMIHASGFGLVITDHGPAEGSNQEQLLADLTEGLETRVRRGVAKDLKKSKKKAVRFAHSRGYHKTMQYFDEDNDKMFYRINVLQSGQRVFSVIVFYDQETKKESEELSNIILQSISSVD